MSSPNIIGNTPVWNYGKNASFGLWVNPLKDSKLFVALYKGVIFTRKTTFLWKIGKPEATSTGDSGGTDGTAATDGSDSSADISSGEEGSEGSENNDENLELSFKQKIEPQIIIVPACGGVVEKSEFPITLFVSGKNVIYSDDKMKKFKKFGQVDEEKFYGLSTGGAASSFDLPTIDKEVYLDKTETTEKTQQGLLIPLWRIDVDVSSTGTLSLKEILDLRSADTFVFERDDSTDQESDGGEGPDPCDSGDGTGSQEGGPDGGGSGKEAEGGASEEEEHGGEEPCPDTET